MCKHVNLQHHAIQYWTLSCVAHDYLAIQGSAVPSEHAFSSGGLTTVACCNQLTGDIFEVLQILKSGYWNGHIQASDQAEAHWASYLEELSYLEVDDESPPHKYV